MNIQSNPQTVLPRVIYPWLSPFLNKEFSRRLVIVFLFVLPLAAYSQPTEICNNGIDDDFDGFIDCYDGTCANDPVCDGLFLGNDATCTAVPPQFPKFTMSLSYGTPNETANHLSRMVIGDYNRDGMPEIATMNRYTKKIFILNGNGGSIKHQKTVTFEPYWEIATANIDNDNCAELFYIGYLPEINHKEKDANGKTITVIDQYEGVYMFAYDCQLNFIWRTELPFPEEEDPINYGLADFDGDGQVEIYAKDEIYDAKTGLRLIKSAALDNPDNIDYQEMNGGPVAINMLGDAKLELVVGLTIFDVDLKTRTKDSGVLTVLQTRNDYFIRYDYNATSIADYNLDGFLDVLASGSTSKNDKNTTVFFWDVKNDVVKTFYEPIGGGDYKYGWKNGTGRLNVADLDGDGKMNVSYVSGKYLYALKEDFTKLWRVTINEETSGYTGCTLFDFNGDGKAEIVYRDERYLYIINGTNGTNYQNPQPCISRTNREYPIVADVNADGSTEICVTCGFDDKKSSDNFNDITYSRYSQVRVFKSAAEPWVPARRVWNQHGYFVVNVNDDLTIPKVIQPHHTVWSVGSCTTGPNRPLNKFLNQSPFLNSKGCPTYAAINLSFSSIKPTITPPQCPDVNYTVSLQLTNLGDAILNGDVPISFYTKNPKKAGSTKLKTISVALTNLGPNDTFDVNNVAINGNGSDSLWLVLNDAGTTVPTPISLPNGTFFECDYTDNVFGAGVVPLPAPLTGLEVAPHNPCISAANGSARAFVPISGGGENTADYNFYWFNGTTAGPIGSANFVGPIYSNIPNGTYTVFARHKTANCNTATVQVVVGTVPGVPTVTITIDSHQTSCTPPNGQLSALVAGGNTGFTFAWYDVALTPLGITGPVAANLPAGNYFVIASRSGCSNSSNPATVQGPQRPDAVGTVLSHIVDCTLPNGGSIQAEALIAGAAQNPAGYTFDWYFYDNGTGLKGSILPPANGTGPVRTGLAAGYYQAVIKDNATGCLSPQEPIVQVQNQTAIPTVTITELAPQTSCDPTKPNGVLTAVATSPGLTSPNDFTFEWFKGDNTLPANKLTTVSGAKGETLNQVAGGGIFHTVKVSTHLNCSGTNKLIITETIVQPVLTLAQLSPNSVCDPTKSTTPFNGSVGATVTFGASTVTLPNANYAFTWHDGPTTADPVIAVADNKNPVLSGVKDGSYTAIVSRTDLFCNSAAKTQVVAAAKILPALSTSSTGSNTCDPALTPDGTVTVTVTNAVGTDVFTYQWYDGAVVGVGPLGAPNNGTSATAINLGGPVAAPHPYTALVLNTTTGCENNKTQFVTDNSSVPVLSFTTIVPNTICAPSTSFNGSLTVQVDNLIAPASDYAFKWYNGNSQAAPVNPSSTGPTLGTLDAGFYTVDVKNTRTGCQSAPTTNQVPNGKINPALTPASTGSNNCDPALTPDGTATVTVTNAGGGDTFSYQWYNGVGVVPGNELGAPNTGTSVTATNLGGPVAAPKQYTVRVTNNATQCQNNTTASVADISVTPVLSVTNITPNTICAPATSFNGSLTVQVNNLILPASDYVFTWHNGATTGAPINPSSTTATLGTIDAGSYTTTVRNTRTGCVSAPITPQVPNGKVNPAIAISSTGSNTCDPAKTPDGTITASVTNSVGGEVYAFAWTAEGPTAPINDATNNANQATAIRVGGPTNAPNTYRVVVTNTGTGCVNTLTGLVADISQKPTFTLTPTNNPICDITIPGGPGAFGGAMTVSAVTHPVIGGSSISYAWFDIDAGGAVEGPNAGSTTSVLGSLDNDKYGVQVTIDDLGCTSDLVIGEVLDAPTPIVLAPSVQPSTNCAPAVSGNGQAQVNVTSPVGTFAYEWYNGGTVSGAPIPGETSDILANRQGTATFTVLVTNLDDGCQNNAPMTVVDGKVTPTIAVTVVQDNTICVVIPGTRDPNGELLATVGAVGPNYTIAWVGGGTQAGTDGEELTLLAAGPYTATVTDDDTGCVSAADGQSIVDDFTYPVLAFTTQPQSSCDTSIPGNGSLAVTGDGGTNTATHDFVWYDGNGTGGSTHAQSSTGVIDGLASGDYTAEVTIEATGCTTIEPRFVPNNIVNPTLTLMATAQVTICGPLPPSNLTPDGAAQASVADFSTTPTGDYTIYYVRTVDVLGAGGATYPTDADDVRGSAEFFNGDGVAAIPPLADLSPGFLTAMIVDNNTTCESVPATVPIDDGTADYTFQINGVATAGLCSIVAPGGEIDITVFKDGVPCGAPCSYEWYEGTPDNTDINFFNNPPDFGADPVITTDEDLGDVNPVGGVSAGTYTVVVRDSDNGCGDYDTQIIPTADPATVLVTPTRPTECVDPILNPINNGAFQVDVTPDATNVDGYTVNIYQGLQIVPGAELISQFDDSGAPFTVNLPNLDKGDYLIVVVDEFPANQPCPQKLARTLTSAVFKPNVTINNIHPNTSCDPNAAADGGVTMTVTKNAQDITVPNYDITTISPLPTGPGFAGVPIAVGASGSTVGPADGLTGFKPQDEEPQYTIRVMDANSFCFRDVVVSIPDAVTMPAAFTVTPTPETECGPGSNGSALASVGADPVTEYDFEWYSDASLATIVYTEPGGGATIGELLDQGKVVVPANWPVGANGEGSGNRTYYARAKKNATAPNGVGCYTQAAQVTISDAHVSPDMVLTPSFNSFCLAVAGGTPGDGAIAIVADADPGTAGQQAGGEFAITWNFPNVATTPPQPTVGGNYTIPQLGTGTYQITATHNTNGCHVINSATVDAAPFIVTVNAHTDLDQLICDPDGNITVTQIAVLDPRTSPATVVVNDMNYSFLWYKAAAGSPGTFNPAAGNELDDAFGTDIIGATLGIDIDKVDEPGEYEAMGAGTYYAVATRSLAAAVAAGCPALPYRVDIQDEHKNPVPTLTPFSNTSCLPGTDEGEIEVRLTDATDPLYAPGGFTYAYTWTGPEAIAPTATNDGDGDGSEPDGDNPTTLMDGVYNIVITNNESGCQTNGTTTITKNATPVFVQAATVLPQILCAPDGSMTVTSVTINDRNGVSVPGAIGDFQFEWTRPNTVAGTQITAGPVLNAAIYTPASFGGTTFGADTYNVVARRLPAAGAPGVGCASAPFKLDILDQRIFPIVSLTPFANTSCDPAFFEGAISVSVVDNSPAVGIAGFTYNWTGGPVAIGAAPFPATNDGDAVGTDGDEDNPQNLQEGAYTMTVESNKSRCITPASTTLFKNGTPVFTQAVTATDQLLCSADGRLEVTEVRVLDRNGNLLISGIDFPLSDFEFTYDRTTVGNTVPGGIVAPVLDVTNYPAIGFDTYFVTSTRATGGPGKDCVSAPFKVDILDKRIFPVATLTPFANTSCDPAFFEGSMTVRVVDNSTFGGSDFTYTWNAGNPSAIAAAPFPATNNGNADGTDGDEDNPLNLSDGTYQMTVENNTSRCVSTASTTIPKSATLITVHAVTPTPQIICLPDGTLTVNEVRLLDNGVVRSSLTDFPLGDFFFAFDRATIGNTVLASSASTVLNAGNYPAIGFDSYFVVATRNNGGPGRGCSTAPFKVDILDSRVFPTLAMTSTVNSSCNPALANGTASGAASELSGVNTGPYTFGWAFNGGALVPPATQTDTNNSSALTGALDGDYALTATNTITGCPVTRSVDLLLDQSRSMPNVIDVNTIDPLDCNPSGQAEVTKITLGSATNSSLIPPNANNEVTGAGLLNFNYLWFKGGLGAPNQLPVTAPCIGPACPTPTAGLEPDSYFAVVTDPTTDCQSGPKEVIITDDAINYPVVNIAQTAKQISCTSGVGLAALSASAAEQDATVGTYDFTWFGSLDLTGPSISGPSATNPNVISNLGVGDYSVEVQNTVTSCRASALFIVLDETAQYLPFLSLTSQPLTMCTAPDGFVLGRVVGLDPTYPFPPSYTADLYFGTNPNLSGPADVAAMPNEPGLPGNFLQSPLTDGTYTMRITDNNTGCTDVDKVDVLDQRAYPAPIVTIVVPNTNCDPLRPNGVANASVNGGTFLGYQFDWFEGASATGTPVYTGVEYGTVKPIPYTLLVTNMISGCTGTLPFAMPDDSRPAADPNIEKLSDVTSCIADNGALSVSVGPDKTTHDHIFEWYNGTQEKPTADFVSELYQDLPTGTYSVIATNVNTGCRSPLKSEDIVTAQEFPEFDFRVVANPSCGDSNGSVTLIMVSNVQIENIEWADGTGPFSVGPNLDGIVAGTYTVTVTSALGCDKTKEIVIEPDVRPFNGISRNGDGQNDFFQIDCIQDFPNNLVKIFNRAGTLVFEAVGYDNASIYFDGQSNKGVSIMGTNLPDGTYFYVIDKRNGSKPLIGYLELVD